MKKSLSLTIFLLIVNLSLFGQTQDWTTFKKDNYSINFPKDWELDQSSENGTSFLLFSPMESSQDKFRENVNFMVQNLNGIDLTLQQFTELSVRQIKAMFDSVEVIESKILSDQSTDYNKIIFKANQDIYNFRIVQYYWVFDDKSYVLTFTCEEERFEDYKITAFKILDSFTFNEQ